MNCVLTCGVETGGGRLRLRLGGLGRLDFAGAGVLGFHGDGSGGRGRVGAAGHALRGLRGALRPLGHGAAQRGGVHRAIRHGNDGADFGQARIVEHEGLVLGRDAVENAVGLGARQQAALRIHGQAGDVRLAGIVVQLAAARAGNAEDLALVAGAHVERAIGPRGQRPDVARLGREVLGGLAVFDAVDLAIGRGAGVDHAAAVHGDGEDFGLFGGPQQRAFAGAVDAINPAAVAGGGVERPSAASATLQITGWSEVKTVSTLGASDRRPSRLSETPSKRPRTKSL